MAKLIIVVGNSGIGKTTLTRALCEGAGYNPGLEQHIERPFQASFKNDHRTYALANQIDYLLLRAEQEQQLRSGDHPGIQDGGLEMDFHVFTRLFLQKGFLNDREFGLCERLYTQARRALPPPEVILYLSAPLDIVTERFARRSRNLEITQQEDLPLIQVLLDRWLGYLDAQRILRVDAAQADPGYRNLLPSLMDEIASRLNNSP
jgi:deoxyadenosine/deoxycytidine kinase